MLLVPLPYVALHATGVGADLSPTSTVLLCSLAVLGSASLLLWAAELAEEFIPRPVVLILVAAVAVLPEACVDLRLAWVAGQNPELLAYTLASLSGSQRLVLGLGGLMVLGLWFLQDRESSVELPVGNRLGMGFLLLATAYSFLLALKGSLTLIDAGILLGIFAGYVARSMRRAPEEREHRGPVGWLKERLPRLSRMALLPLLLVYSGATVWLATGTLTVGLLSLSSTMGADGFLVLHGAVPLAAELPLLSLVLLLVAHREAARAVDLLIAAALHQWTLGIAALPCAYALATDGLAGLPLTSRPQETLLLSAAQALFTLALFAKLRFALWEGALLGGLYLLPWIFRDAGLQYIVAGLYFVLVLVLGLSTAERRMAVGKLLRFGD